MAADSLSLISGRGVVIYQGKTDKSFIKSRSTTSIAGGGGGALFLSLSRAAVHTVCGKNQDGKEELEEEFCTSSRLFFFFTRHFIYKRTKDERKILSLSLRPRGRPAPLRLLLPVCQRSAFCKYSLETHMRPNK